MAEPLVIYDSGETESLSRYLAIINTDRPPLPVMPSQLPQTLRHFPVVTKNLSPGKVLRQPIQQPHLTQPLFIVGDDALSRQWLVQNREILKKIQAIGMVVNVASAQKLNELRQIAQGLDLHPVPGDKIARQLHLQHYPVLITSTRIEQ